MQLGFFTMPIHPLGKDWRLCLREDRDAFILADELGFDAFFVGDHPGYATEPWIHLGAIAAQTTRIGLGSVVNLQQESSAALKMVYAEILTTVRQQQRCNTDETGWKQAGACCPAPHCSASRVVKSAPDIVCVARSRRESTCAASISTWS